MRPESRYQQTGPQEHDDEAAYWQPQQTIPVATTPLDSYDLDYDEGRCQDKLWNDIKSLVTGEFLKFEACISQRLECLEDKVSSLSQKVDSLQSADAVSSSPVSSTPSSRKRKSPLSLQVLASMSSDCPCYSHYSFFPSFNYLQIRIRGVHKSLSEDHQLHADES